MGNPTVQEPAMRNVSFRKSSYSNASGECVEVAPFPPRLVAVRDSKDAGGCWLSFTADGWQEFVSQVRGGHSPVN
jgi:hypothetical protein